MKVKVSDYIAEFFIQKGVKHVFTVTGGGAMHLNASLGHKEGLTCIYNHHEQACAIAAEGYTKLSGKLALVCVTSGPGGTNAITGVLCAWLDSIPMFILSGQVKRGTTITACRQIPLRQLGDQEYNITDSVSYMTKYAEFISNPLEVAYHLEKAYYLCNHGRGGPVWLDIPLDVQSAMIETDDLLKFDSSELELEVPIYKKELTGTILNKLKESKRPVILAGSGIRLGKAHKQFIDLIEKLNIPVVTAWNAHDSLWNAHPLYCGRPGTLGTRGGNFVVQNSDLLISFGCRLNIRQISYSYQEFAKQAYKIIVDIDKAELEKPTIWPDLPIHADVKDVIEDLLQSNYKSMNKEHPKWLKWCREIDRKYPATLPDYYRNSSPINPYVFMEKLFQNLNENEIIITGNGSACVISFQAAWIKKGQRLFTNSGCAPMGYGLPAAFGGSLASDGNRIICLDGDGSIQMNLQELQTLVYHQSEVKLFVLNNQGYHSIRQTQQNLLKGKFAGISKENGISFPSMEKIAYAYGIPYYQIREIGDIDYKVQKTISTSGPTICEIILDISQNFEPKLAANLLPDGTIVSPEIDDLFPFLDRVEYETIKQVTYTEEI